MRKLLSLLCLCLLVASSAFTMPLSDCYADQALGVFCFGNNDAKYLLGLEGKETETTKVTREVISCIKKRFAIDLENELEQIGGFIVPTSATQAMGNPAGNAQPNFEFIGFIGGNLNPKNIVPLIKEMATADKDSIKIGTISVNGKKAQALFAKDFRLIFYSKKILLFCKDSAVKLMENQELTFSKAPKSVEGLMERSNSFIYLGKSIAGLMVAKIGEMPINGMENVESVSAYLKDGFAYCEAGFPDESQAKSVMANIEQFKKSYCEEQKQVFENAKKALKSTSLDNVLEEIQKLYTAAKNQDVVNDFSYSQKGASIIAASPFDAKGKAMITVAGIGVIAAMAIPNFKKARDNAREKACFSNIRVISMAIEMYNLDHSTFMTNLDMQALVDGQYLKSYPRGPEPDCEYYSVGDLSADGYIACKRHGKIGQ